MVNVSSYNLTYSYLTKVLDTEYATTSDDFEIPSGTYLVGAGVFIIAQDISWEAVVISQNVVRVYFSKERLEEFGYGTWPFEIRANFSNGHTITLAVGNLKITPYA